MKTNNIKASLDFLENPEVFEINRLEAHSNHRYYRSLEDAKNLGDMADRKSLNGLWQFSFAKNPNSRIIDFYRQDDDCRGWDQISVPGHIQLQGYDKPHYVNTMYPWDGHNDINPPTIPSDYNPVGSYIKYFEVPKDWEDSPVYLSFQGVESAFYLWVNGKFVGYSEDTFTPAGFDITPYLQEGDNKIALGVYKWCSGSWLEDQDFWRLSGIFRDVYLYTVPKVHVRDMFVTTELDEQYKNAVVKNATKATIRFSNGITGKSKPISLIAVGARDNPITIIIGPTITGGNNLLIHAFPETLIIHEIAKYNKPTIINAVNTLPLPANA